jgi:hypothetical protein
MSKTYTIELQKGETLVTLLVFMVVAMTITTSAAVMILNNSRGATKLAEGIEASHVAESGIENATLRLMRDPTYTGETLTVNNGTVVIQVSGTTTKVVIATATVGNSKRKIQMNAGYSNGILMVTPPLKEIQ